ncbi:MULTISPECIES: DUF2061 domain-containing protein [Modicisalibacter]|uniref:DUF2061 domain-containing protein n=1 Tax=Modicisalibacter tunisiensis TaxID=390637 RepID=A0ABS7X2W2_9GAMM|nr:MULTISPECIES: DUF2061 domain-containing protein [Modicisalibacter]MBZ9537346.1 DUF2061 domain-containing protein [Modicisalibacter tunisiensis]MBZ9569232.1 DUF2061 domain-containing protein [Modicisalibacter tunisiensis]
MLKTLTFACVHFSVAFTVTWLLTGSWVVGGLIALVEPAINSVAYFLHEKAWERLRRRRDARDRRLPLAA